MIKIFKRFKKISKILTIFLLFFCFNNVLAYDDEQHYDFSWLGDLWTWTTNFYLWDISSTSDFTLNVVYESYDCEVYNDFAFILNWVATSIPCSWDWNWIYNIEFWTFENLTANSVYEMYLTQYTEDTWGLWKLDLYIDYIDNSTTENINTDYENIYFWQRFTIFSDVDDFRQFLIWQIWLLIFIYLSIMIVKIFIYKRI